MSQYPSLEPDQQKLLLAALNSNRRKNQEDSSSPDNGRNAAVDDWMNRNGLPSVTFDENYPFGTHNDDSDLNDLLSRVPDDADDFADTLRELDNEYGGEKRKSPDERDDEDEQDDGDPKRQENDDRAAKKPGRKLLTSEPTTKRKAQNRAAQRAFRERKEKHVKDLENRVSDLEQISESANHENGVLRAQIERLQTELREYRKRVSLTGSTMSQSPPRIDSHSPSQNNSNFDFNFDFPRFGSMSAPQTQQTTHATSGQRSNTWDAAKSHAMNSTRQNNNASASQKSNPQHSTSFSLFEGNQSIAGDSLGGIFSPGSIDGLGSVGFGLSNAASPSSINHSQSNTSSSSKRSQSSPSNYESLGSPPSSVSNRGAESSCTSPDALDTWANGYVNGNQIQGSKDKSNATNTGNTVDPGSVTFDWLSSQNNTQFDPVLFGDYREPQENIVGNGDFTSGFFDEPSVTNTLFPDFSDPFNFNLATDSTVPAPVQAPSPAAMAQNPSQRKTPNLMDQVNSLAESGDNLAKKNNCSDQYNDSKDLMTCHKIWNQLQNCPQFKSGEFDIDALCTELASKAKCTESGVAVPKHFVEKALWRLAGSSVPPDLLEKSKEQPKDSTPAPGRGGLNAMFPGLA